MVADSLLFSIADVANACGVTVKTVRAWEKAGKIPVAQRVGGKRRYSSSDIDKIRQLTAKHTYNPEPAQAEAVDGVPKLVEVGVQDDVVHDDVVEPRPWPELLEEDDWPAYPARDARGQPRPSGPRCPACQRAVHQITVDHEQMWVCGAHGLVKPHWMPPEGDRRGVVSFSANQPPRAPRRGLSQQDVVGAVRRSRATNPPPGSGYLDPAPQPTRPSR